MDEQVCPAAQPKAGKPLRGQNLMEWYEALISAALVLVLVFSFFPCVWSDYVFLQGNTVFSISNKFIKTYYNYGNSNY